MSTLPSIVEAMCYAVAKHDQKRARQLVFQAAAKMGEPRSARILNWMHHDGEEPMTGFVALDGKKMRHWSAVNEPRAPWVPASVAAAVEQWTAEVMAADALADAGERVQPLLLAGETRCGKTSMLCGLAKRLRLPMMRLSLSEAVGSYLGETSKKIRDALDEMKACPPAVWLIDEIDAVAFSRIGGSAAAQERSHAVGSLLTELDTLPGRLPLAATTNLVSSIDSAVLGRFSVVEFPTWDHLGESDREAFAASHGARAVTGDSYADVVKKCRQRRVDAVLRGRASGESEAA